MAAGESGLCSLICLPEGLPTVFKFIPPECSRDYVYGKSCKCPLSVKLRCERIFWEFYKVAVDLMTMIYRVIRPFSRLSQYLFN